MDTELRQLCERLGLPALSGGRVAVEAACERIAELEAHLLVMTDHATNKAGGYLAKDHPDVLRSRELTRGNK